MYNVSNYLNMVFGCDVSKRSINLKTKDMNKVYCLFDGRVGGFEKEVVYKNLSKMVGFAVNDNTFVISLLN